MAREATEQGVALEVSSTVGWVDLRFVLLTIHTIGGLSMLTFREVMAIVEAMVRGNREESAALSHVVQCILMTIQRSNASFGIWITRDY